MDMRRFFVCTAAVGMGSVLLAAAFADVFSIDGLAVDGLAPEEEPPEFLLVKPMQMSIVNTNYRPVLSRSGFQLRTRPLTPEIRRIAHPAFVVIGDRLSTFWNETVEYFEGGITDASLQDVERDLLNKPGNPSLLRNAAMAALISEKPGKAQRFFRGYLFESPATRDIDQVVWADLLLQLDYLDIARAAIETVLAEDPGNLPARLIELMVLVKSLELDVPIGQWKNLSLSETGSLAVWLDYNQDQYLDILGRRNFNIVSEIVLGLKDSTMLWDVRRLLLDLHRDLKAGHWDAANQSIQQLKARGVNRPAIAKAAIRCMSAMGDHKEALVLAGQMVRARPNDFAGWLALGHEALVLGRYEMAENALLKSLDLVPDSAQANLMLAGCYALQGRIPDALPIVKKFAKERPQLLDTWYRSSAPGVEIIRKTPELAESLDALR